MLVKEQAFYSVISEKGIMGGLFPAGNGQNISGGHGSQ